MGVEWVGAVAEGRIGVLAGPAGNGRRPGWLRIGPFPAFRSGVRVPLATHSLQNVPITSVYTCWHYGGIPNALEKV